MDRYDHVFEKKNLKNINGLYLILFHELLLGKESSELDSFDHVFKTRTASPPREQDLIFYDRAIAIATIFWKKSDIPKYTICLILRGVAWLLNLTDTWDSSKALS